MWAVQVVSPSRVVCLFGKLLLPHLESHVASVGIVVCVVLIVIGRSRTSEEEGTVAPDKGQSARLGVRAAAVP
jgi:hypothetical protein